MTDFMVDIETISTKPNAAIVAIGACEFDMETGKTGRRFYTNIDWKSNQGYGRSVDLNTIKWWMKQSDAARMALLEGETATLPSAMLKFALFYKECGNLPIWSHANFDEQILRNAFEAVDIVTPWHFRDIRDIRTLMGMLPRGTDIPGKREGTHHNALDDALFQCQYVSQAHRFLKTSGEV